MTFDELDKVQSHLLFAHMDPYTLAYMAGHSDFFTTKRYVHPQEETVLAAMDRARS